MRKLRKDAAMARKVDIALVMRKLSGEDVARQYLRGAYVDAAVIERVLSGGAARAGMTPGSWPPPGSGITGPDPEPRCGHYAATGRRRDVASAAIVQAAITVRDQLDAARAENLLRREALPEEVIARVLAGTEPRRQFRPAPPANGHPPEAKINDN